MDILNHFIKINRTFCVARESKFSIWHHLHLSMLPICIALITDRGAKHMLRSLRDFPPAIRGNNKPNFTLKNKLGKAQGEEIYLFVFKWHFSALMKLEASRIKGCYFSNLSFLCPLASNQSQYGLLKDVSIPKIHLEVRGKRRVAGGDNGGSTGVSFVEVFLHSVYTQQQCLEASAVVT